MEVAAAKQLLPMRDAINSPSSSSSSTYSSSSPSPSRQQHQHHPLPPSPKPVPRVIDTATTFVQADTASFKQVVQMLTGSTTQPPPSQTKPAARNHNHQHHSGGGHSPVPCRRPKKPAFKLYDRRGLKNLKTIAPLAMAAAAAGPSSPRKTLLSPSVLDFPSLALGSPVTPLVADPFNRSPLASASPSPGEEEEAVAERAVIARKGFFLRPSPRSAAEPPRLLPLFPVTSPRMMASSAAAAPSYQ